MKNLTEVIMMKKRMRVTTFLGAVIVLASLFSSSVRLWAREGDVPTMPELVDQIVNDAQATVDAVLNSMEADLDGLSEQLVNGEITVEEYEMMREGIFAHNIWRLNSDFESDKSLFNSRVATSGESESALDILNWKARVDAAIEKARKEFMRKWLKLYQTHRPEEAIVESVVSVVAGSNYDYLMGNNIQFTSVTSVCEEDLWDVTLSGFYTLDDSQSHPGNINYPTYFSLTSGDGVPYGGGSHEVDMANRTFNVFYGDLPDGVYVAYVRHPYTMLPATVVFQLSKNTKPDCPLKRKEIKAAIGEALDIAKDEIKGVSDDAKDNFKTEVKSVGKTGGARYSTRAGETVPSSLSEAVWNINGFLAGLLLDVNDAVIGIEDQVAAGVSLTMVEAYPDKTTDPDGKGGIGKTNANFTKLVETYRVKCSKTLTKLSKTLRGKEGCEVYAMVVSANELRSRIDNLALMSSPPERSSETPLVIMTIAACKAVGESTGSILVGGLGDVSDEDAIEVIVSEYDSETESWVQLGEPVTTTAYGEKCWRAEISGLPVGAYKVEARQGEVHSNPMFAYVCAGESSN